MDAKDWQAPAAYLYLLHVDASGLAWEYLRRNHVYQQEWERFGLSEPPHVIDRWGLL